MARAASLIFALLASCGPSLRLQYQGTVYFERCYAADLDPTIRLEAKETCWEAWLEHYSSAQPPHRVRYAQHRDTALAAGETIAPVIRMPFEMWDATQSAVFLSGVADVGTPPELSDDESEEPREMARRGPPGDPDATCTNVCTPRWNRCVSECARAPDDTCISACEVEHRFCIGGC